MWFFGCLVSVEIWGLSRFRRIASHYLGHVDALRCRFYATRANDGIPSPRHRARTSPIEQSIRFPWSDLTCKRKLDWPLKRSPHFLRDQHHKSCCERFLITMNHFAVSQDCAVVTSNPFSPSLCCVCRGNEGSHRRMRFGSRKQE
jgi:hypothetical protein